MGLFSLNGFAGPSPSIIVYYSYHDATCVDHDTTIKGKYFSIVKIEVRFSGPKLSAGVASRYCS